MKDAVSEILFSLVSLLLFAFSIFSLLSRVNTEQNLVKTFKDSNYVREEMQLQSGKSEYEDYWNGSEWVSPVIRTTTGEILNEIYSSNPLKTAFYIGSMQIPVEEIQKYQETGNAVTILSYLYQQDYQKVYEYNDNGILAAVKYS